jgi:hypothetical protein
VRVRFERGLARLTIPAEVMSAFAAGGLVGSEAWAWVEALAVEGLTLTQARRLAESALLAGLAELDLRHGDPRAPIL